MCAAACSVQRVPTPTSRAWAQGCETAPWLVLALLACLLLGSARLALAEAGQAQAEVRARANLREGPGRSERVRAVLARGEQVTVLRRQDEWLQVRRRTRGRDGQSGWVHQSLLLIRDRSAQDEIPARKPEELVDTQRRLVQVLVPAALVYPVPATGWPAVARVEQGTHLECDEKRGDWYRVRLRDRSYGWLFNAPAGSTHTLVALPFPIDRHIAGDVPDPVTQQHQLAANDAAMRSDAEQVPAVAAEAPLPRRRPQSVPLEPRLPIIDAQQVPPPSPYLTRESTPVRDRWRIVKSLGLLPYDRRDPYNPNELKGDLPVLEKQLGEEWFFNLGAISDSLLEFRELPTPVGAQASSRAGSYGTLGKGRQSVFSETVIASFGLIKGDTVFKPPEYEFRFVPVLNFNRAVTQERRAVNVDPGYGSDRNDAFIGIQELFVDKHLRDVSPRYDFDSVRVGIQPFSADFRGFLFLDQPFGVRLFGIRDDNRWQYNLGWFRRLEKDTNSGLNDVTQTMRKDDSLVVNLYRQDWPVQGFTSQGVVLHNRNREGDRGQYYNDNDFLERPAVLGTGRPRNYDVTYLGANGDGHFRRWNLSASGYWAVGQDDRGPISGHKESISALFGALELSRDFDWIRVRGSALYASGDRNPYDNQAGGFDAVLENPQFAGADTSYWIRQSIPLIGGGGTALSIRNGVLASLRTSREHGQSNFTNPGLHLLGIGADIDASTGLRFTGNVNYLEFDNMSSLATLRNQRFTSNRIGFDVSIGVQYRPLFNQNIVLNASFAQLIPDNALRELYGDALDGTVYSALVNLLLTF
jgi:SH3-like domain-containing protein